MKNNSNPKFESGSQKKQKQFPLEMLMAELGSYLTTIEPIELKEIEQSIEQIKGLIDNAFELSLQIEERLGSFEKAKKIVSL